MSTAAPSRSEAAAAAASGVAAAPAPDAPLVSVLMPARDAEGFVGDAARSVLAETGVAIELIVVEDGSTDGTAAELAAFDDPRLRVVPGPRAGISAALNAGAAAARGDFLARCDADDLFVPGRLAAQVATLDAAPDAAAVAGGYASLSDRGREISVMDTGDEAADLTDELLAGRTRTHLGAWLVRRSAWEAVGGARPWFACAEDLDLQCRLAGAGRVLYRPGVAYRYRLHDASTTHRLASERRAFFDAAVVRFAGQRRSRGADDLDRGEAPEPPASSASASRMSSRRQAQGHLMAAAHRAALRGHTRAALRMLARALATDPANARRWPHLARQAASTLLASTGLRRPHSRAPG